MDRDIRIDCMIDLETLDTETTAIILSIGACLFDIFTGEIIDEFYYVISIDDQVRMNRTISQSTLLWWMDQGNDATSAVFRRDIERTPLKSALYLLRQFIPERAKVWSNGSNFDISMLDNAYVDCESPWNFWDIRDVRTIVDAVDGFIDRSDIEFEGTPHNALDDAKHQAKYISIMYQRIRRSLESFEVRIVQHTEPLT